jgi:predicted phosphodiesterase
MKTLIIPDVHNRVKWIEPFLKMYKDVYGYDEVVFLGDYFDAFNDGPGNAARTATWLHESLTQPDRIHCMGNHDMPYMFPHKMFLRCPGWTEEKNKAVSDIMTQEDWRKLVPCHETQGWLLSHAGAAEWVFSHPIFGITTANVIKKCNDDLEKIRLGSNEEYSFGSGWRMANIRQIVGGITWLDWNNEFLPVPGINQIVGHTHGNNPRWCEGVDSINWCIDTHSDHVGILHDGVLTFTQSHGVIHHYDGHVVAYHKTENIQEDWLKWKSTKK